MKVCIYGSTANLYFGWDGPDDWRNEPFWFVNATDLVDALKSCGGPIKLQLPTGYVIASWHYQDEYNDLSPNWLAGAIHDAYEVDDGRSPSPEPKPTRPTKTTEGDRMMGFFFNKPGSHW